MHVLNHVISQNRPNVEETIDSYGPNAGEFEGSESGTQELCCSSMHHLIDACEKLRQGLNEVLKMGEGECKELFNLA